MDDFHETSRDLSFRELYKSAVLQERDNNHNGRHRKLHRMRALNVSPEVTVTIPEESVFTEVPGNGCHIEEALDWLTATFSSSGFAEALNEQTRLNATIEVTMPHAMPLPTCLSFIRDLTQQRYPANILSQNHFHTKENSKA